MDSSVTVVQQLQKPCRRRDARLWHARLIHGRKRPVKQLTVVALSLLLSVLAVASCGKDIGDECLTSADCDPNGSRSCDLSQPGGYCTVLGCDQSSCPSGSFCIRYFPTQYLSTVCDPQCEDLPACATGPCAEQDPQMCLPACPATCPQGARNDCAIDEVCLDAEVCARRSLEQRTCVKGCGSNGDCRGGYECRLAGTEGSMLLSANPAETVHFCAPAAM
jgi:hypothetical protein